ncbi:MAG: hypothetical protein U9R15_12050 [Chloroflexota bacterium]|nr:hypothetical protein [Chloroflexota bacterium]
MSKSDMNNSSETDWAMIDSLTDETIDRSELASLDESFFARATWRMSKGQATITVPIDLDLLTWFRAQGSECERRIIAALRIYVEAHQDIIRQPELTVV